MEFDPRILTKPLAADLDTFRRDVGEDQARRSLEEEFRPAASSRPDLQDHRVLRHPSDDQFIDQLALPDPGIDPPIAPDVLRPLLAAGRPVPRVPNGGVLFYRVVSRRDGVGTRY